MRGLSIILLMGSLAFAQDDGDPPSRAARLSFINGSVSFQPGGVDDWVQATPNRPLTTGDRLWTDDNSRVEMNLGSAAFRLSSRSNFTFLNLDDRTAQVQLSVGTLNVRLRHLDDDQTYEIDTPQVAFTLLRPGEYRVEVDEAGDATIVTVRGGDGEATANGQAFAIHAREQVRIAGPEGADPILDRRTMPAADQFDNFCEARDRREDMSVSAKYVSRDMPGYADLDAAGTWSNDPQFGAVWVPNGVEVGWSPYHYGHWAWIGGWGWTWVDDAPWGYAPFHYGRWAQIGPRWGWIPGPIAVRPVYAPAMVAFVGGGGASFGVAWFPLGPREVWVPSYHVSAGYMTRVNVSNTVVTEVNVRNVYTNVYVNHTTVTNVYVNQRVPGAVVAVRADVMTGGRPVAAAAVHIDVRAMANVTVIHAAPVAPAREAVLGGRAPMAAGVHMPPAAVMSRQVVAKAAPPPPPVAFARQQQELQAHPGQPLNQGAVRTLQASQPAPRMNIRAASPSAPAAKIAPPAPAPNRMNARPTPPPPAANPAPVRPENAPARPAAPPAAPERKPMDRPANPTPPPTGIERRAEPAAPRVPPSRPVTPPGEPERKPDVERPVKPASTPAPVRPAAPPAHTDSKPEFERRTPDAAHPAAEARKPAPPADRKSTAKKRTEKEK